MKVNIGINEKDRKKVAEAVNGVLADSYVLMVKTHNYHWNVEGPHFKALHDMFMEQYTELFAAVDELAERVRALGHYAVGDFGSYLKMSPIKEETKNPKAMDMVKNLAGDHETLAKRCGEVLDVAGKAEDDVTVDIMTQRITLHEKTAWMLRSFAA